MKIYILYFRGITTFERDRWRRMYQVRHLHRYISYTIVKYIINLLVF